MNAKRRKLLVVNAAALGYELVRGRPPPAPGLPFRKLRTVFPAVTCSVQASFRSASLPRAHGIVANGFYARDLRKVLFWEQAASLVAGERIWKPARAQGLRVGLLFWQQSLGEESDLVLSPRPVHKHRGGLIQDCYSRPAPLYAELTAALGRPFDLMRYWGPLASRAASDWIVEAVRAVLARPDAPDLLLAYVPHLDYDLQRHGPDSPRAQAARDVLWGYLAALRESAGERGFDVLVFGDYAMGPADGGAVFPNRALREAGLFAVREVRGMAYADFFASGAFALVDHEIAHVYASDEPAARRAGEVLAGMRGVERMFDRAEQSELGIDHPRSGELVLLAAPGCWFAYPWWERPAEAPDFASHVDIHNKPGFDPCELFFGWPPPNVSRDTDRVRGTHGRNGPGREVAWATTCALDREPETLIELAGCVRDWLESCCWR